MCLAIPGKIVAIRGLCADVEFGGVVKKNISIFLCPEAKVNEYVLVHAGNVLDIINEAEALETLALLNEWRS